MSSRISERRSLEYSSNYEGLKEILEGIGNNNGGHLQRLCSKVEQALNRFGKYSITVSDMDETLVCPKLKIKLRRPHGRAFSKLFIAVFLKPSDGRTGDTWTQLVNLVEEIGTDLGFEDEEPVIKKRKKKPVKQDLSASDDSADESAALTIIRDSHAEQVPMIRSSRIRTDAAYSERQPSSAITLGAMNHTEPKADDIAVPNSEDLSDIQPPDSEETREDEPHSMDVARVSTCNAHTAALDQAPTPFSAGQSLVPTPARIVSPPKDWLPSASWNRDMWVAALAGLPIPVLTLEELNIRARAERRSRLESSG